MTTGTTSQIAVLAALNNRNPDFYQDGVRSLDKAPVIYISDQGHESFVKIVQICGLGRSSLRRIASDARFRIRVDALEEQIAAAGAKLQHQTVRRVGPEGKSAAVAPVQLRHQTRAACLGQAV